MKHFVLISIFLLIFSAIVWAAPEAISNLTALSTADGASVGEGEVKLEWTVPDPGGGGAPDHYLVKLSTIGEIRSADFYESWVDTYTHTWSSLETSGNKESRVLTNLTPSVTYYFAIKASDGSDYGVWNSSSDTSGAFNNENFTVVYDSIPVQASGLSATLGTGFIDLSWTANSELDIAEYEVERSTYSDQPSDFTLIETIVSPGTTHQDVFTLVSGNTYYYRVRAKDNTNHTGDYSQIVDTMAWVGTAIWDWNNFGIYQTSMCWAWSLADDATGYRVINSSSGANISGDLADDATFFIQTDLTPNTSPAAYVQTFNDYVATNSIIISSFTLTTVPTLIGSTRTTSSISLQWDRNGCSDFTRYSVKISTETDKWPDAMVLAQSTTHQSINLPEAHSCVFRIWAINNDGVPEGVAKSGNRLEVTTTTLSIAPNAPSFLDAEMEVCNNDGEVRLSWIPSGDDGSDGDCSSYLIKWATYTITESNFDSITVSSSVADTGESPERKFITGLYPGTTYMFALRAKDEVDNESFISNVSTAAALDIAPPKITSVNVTTNSSFTVTVEWNIPDIEGTDDRDKYKIYRASFSFESFVANVSTFVINHPLNQATTSYEDRDPGTGQEIKQETTYYYRISCLDKGPDEANGLFSHVIESTWSAIAYVRTPDTNVPATIDVNATQGDNEGEILLTWTSPGDDGDGGDIIGGKFHIDYNDVGSGFSKDLAQIKITTTTSPGSQNALLITGLSEGTTFYFAIWTRDEETQRDPTYNWSGISSIANTWAQVDVEPPGPITHFIATSNWKRVELTWMAPGDNTYEDAINNGKFKIEYSINADFSSPATSIFSTSTVFGEYHYYMYTDLTNAVTRYFRIYTADERENWSLTSVSTPTFYANNTAPSDFSLASPTDNYISPVSSPTLTWNAPSDPDITYGDSISYEVYYSTDQNFTTSVTTIAATADTQYQPTLLPENKTVYWRVKAFDTDGGESGYTNTWSMEINTTNSAPYAFSLLTPAVSSITPTATPTVTWGESGDIDPGNTVYYRIEYSQYVDFSTYTYDSGLSTTTYTLPSLTENATYYWRVWATDNITSTLCDDTYNIRINAEAEAPTAFYLSSPTFKTRFTTTTVEFSWETASDPDPAESVQYNLIYSTYSDFASYVTVAGLTQNTTSLVLNDNEKYYWKVLAVGTDNESTTSDFSLSYLVSDTNPMFYIDIAKQEPSTFTLRSPYNVTLSTTQRPWFFWEEAVDPDPIDEVHYYIDISPNADFSGSQPQASYDKEYFRPLEDLVDQTTYYWRVRASGYQGSPPEAVDLDESGEPIFVYSETGVFAISMTNSPPYEFNLVSPSSSTVYTKTPKFEWEAAEDKDFNDYVTYDLSISTTSDFSVLFTSAISISSTYYTLTTKLSENRRYHWKVIAKDLKSATTSCINNYWFDIPVLTKPVAPVGLSGLLSSDRHSFTLYWSSVSLNTDGSTIDDLGGYNIYRAVSMSAFDYTNYLSSVPSGTHQYTDSTISGGNFYYLIRTFDTSDVESDDSKILESLQPDKLYVVSSDEEVTVEVPGDVSKFLLAQNNQYNKNLTMTLERNTTVEDKLKSQGINDILKVYDLKLVDKDSDEITGCDFPMPISLKFDYRSIEQAPARYMASPLSFSAQGLSTYWFNGVEYVDLGGYIDQTNKQVITSVIKPGEYQLRQVARTSSFNVTIRDSGKVFTPGEAPYEKLTFNINNPTGDKVIGKIFDLRGEFIADLQAVGNDVTSTTVLLEWDGSGARKGVYIYQIEAEGRVYNGTVILAR